MPRRGWFLRDKVRRRRYNQGSQAAIEAMDTTPLIGGPSPEPGDPNALLDELGASLLDETGSSLLDET